MIGLGTLLDITLATNRTTNWEIRAHGSYAQPCERNLVPDLFL
jgi:hypothetical protein